MSNTKGKYNRHRWKTIRGSNWQPNLLEAVNIKENMILCKNLIKEAYTYDTSDLILNKQDAGRMLEYGHMETTDVLLWVLDQSISM